MILTFQLLKLLILEDFEVSVKSRINEL